jgi:Asp-tRNA(Asn)/Glu-tRNA(Gln) amidotransferase A subunit family amidase
MSPPHGPAAGVLSRRRFLALLSAATTAPIVGGAAATGQELAADRVAAAEELLGLEFSSEQRELMLEGLAELRQGYQQIRAVLLHNEVPPALRFDPRPEGFTPPPPPAPGGPRPAPGPLPAPASPQDLALLPVAELSRLVRARRISALELARLYLDRCQRLDPLLEAVITVTEERALEAAGRADRELAMGRWRGPLHGIPWGAKDLLATEGYRTTWGAGPFRDQVLPQDATVVRRLEGAGAVLIAKLTLGELAWGDVWYGGMTRNPWNLEQGSSGSSAGSAAATVAGLVGFAIGSETWGSIVSPATRTGATGLRPTFGRVSRHGAMALAWSMDKIGPLCRSVEDCALVFAAIHGPDPEDPTTVAAPFEWQPALDPASVRIGYTASLFEEPPPEGGETQRRHDLQTLDTLRHLGFQLVPIELPEMPGTALSLILTAEAAAAFDAFTRSGQADELVRQVALAWPNVFRMGRLVPAVEYLQANRVRTLMIRQMAQLMSEVDLYVAPTFGGDNLLMTNLTGHPAVVLPNGFAVDGTPTSATFTGRLFDEATLLAVAHRYQEATGFHRRHPDLERLTAPRGTGSPEP